MSPVQSDATTECSICGHVPGPYEGCETCHGNRNFVRPRGYTLTEIRRGEAPNDERYGPGRTGNVSPKVVSLPGSYNPTVPTPRPAEED